MIVCQQVGLWLLIWFTCRECYRRAVRHVEHAYAASVEAAWAEVRSQGGAE